MWDLLMNIEMQKVCCEFDYWIDKSHMKIFIGNMQLACLYRLSTCKQNYVTCLLNDFA